MTKVEIDILRDIFIKLGKIVQKYGQGCYEVQLKILSKIINCIDSDSGDSEKTVYIIKYYKVLFPSQGGLSEFYIHDEDFQIRLRLNEPLDKLREELWGIMKKYI